MNFTGKTKMVIYNMVYLIKARKVKKQNKVRLNFLGGFQQILEFKNIELLNEYMERLGKTIRPNITITGGEDNG